jgi:hypothetical protein
MIKKNNYKKYNLIIIYMYESESSKNLLKELDSQRTKFEALQ